MTITTHLLSLNQGEHWYVKPDILKEDKSLNKGQSESTLAYTLYRKITFERGQPLYLLRTKRLVPKVSLLRGFTVCVLIKDLACPSPNGNTLSFVTNHRLFLCSSSESSLYDQKFKD